jgi:hypothetical protein
MWQEGREGEERLVSATVIQRKTGVGECYLAPEVKRTNEITCDYVGVNVAIFLGFTVCLEFTLNSLLWGLQQLSASSKCHRSPARRCRVSCDCDHILWGGWRETL